MTLFSFDFSPEAFQPGEIVRQAFPLVLSHRGHNLMPFWQVHHSALWYGRRIVMCRSVPFTTGGADMYGFHDEDLVHTGISWRIPDYGEVQQWFIDLGTNQFVAALNDVTLPPHPEEAELVRLLEQLGPVVLPNRHGEFYAQFPAPTAQQWREKARTAR